MNPEAGWSEEEVDLHKYLVIVERAERNYSAYSPDLPGCVATGDTREEVERRMAEAMRMHVDGLREDHLPIPEPCSFAEYISVA